MKTEEAVLVGRSPAPRHLRSSGSADIYGISDLIKTAKESQKATISGYASSSFSSELVPRSDQVEYEGRKRQAREAKIHFGTVTLAGWAHAAYGNRTWAT